MFPGALPADSERKAGAGTVREALAAAPANHIKSGVCMFTNTGDGHFMLDAFALADGAAAPSLTFVSACAGHGYKFATAIGEAAADLATKVPRPDLRWLSTDRFAPKL